MNQPHNRNQYAHSPEKTVAQIRLEVVQRAVSNSEQAENVLMMSEPEVVVSEIFEPIAPPVQANVAEIQDRIAAMHVTPPTFVPEPGQTAPVIPLKRPQTPPNTLPINEMYGEYSA